MKKNILIVILTALACMPMHAQIMLSPCVESAIDGLTSNNVLIAENKLRNVISSLGQQSADGSRFVLACKISALDSEVTGTKLIQRLDVTYAVGDELTNTCYGSTSVEVTGIGNTEAQAMTSALRNLRPNAELKKIVSVATERIKEYYDKNSPAIIKKAKTLMAKQSWEEALYELAYIPEESACYSEALDLMETIYKANLNHDAKQLLSQAQALWSADPNPGETAKEALELLGQINTSAECYSQAKALMRKIENRNEKPQVVVVQHVQSTPSHTNTSNVQTTQNTKQASASRKKAVQNAQKARVKACRDVAAAYAQSKPKVRNHSSWM